ncbi:MAG: hypothetical protein HY834_20590 [Devosia nanyangense]|uniref:Uncharacterized protein n=1 Tax=Devosia nanyangense TaxID=1228055 RepID=A0A933P0M2_9HYPH|nr:hypothetical protein [Devosia nanyangense]
MNLSKCEDSIVMRPPGGSAGFVQLMALVALATISAVITASIVGATTGGRTSAALERLIRSDAVATSGFVRLEAAIIDASDSLETGALAPTSDARVGVGDVQVGLRIEAEDGKIDVLRADRDLLARYLANARLPPDVEVRMLGAIDEARAREDGGAGLEAVRRALLEQGDEASFYRDFTQFGSSGIDPVYASDRVLASFPDLSPAEVAQLIRTSPEARATGSIRSRYFKSGGRRFALVSWIDWSVGQRSELRLPIEISAAGKPIRLAGPSS